MEAPAPPPAEPSPRGINTGQVLALAGASLVLFSATLGWMEHPLVQVSGIPFRPSQVTVLPFLLRIRTVAQFPSVGQLIVVLGVLAAAPPVLGLRHPGWDIARRIAGLLALAVVVLFPFGYDFLFGEAVPEGLLASLRLGIFVAALGGLLVVIGGGRLGRDAGPKLLRKGVSAGAVLAFLGLAALAYSTQMTWVDQGFIPEGTPDPGILGGDVALLPLISRTVEAQILIPTVGHVVMALVIGGAFLIYSGRRGADLIRRALGLVALIICALFAFRTHQLAEVSGESFGYTMIGLLRIGFLVAVLGGILTMVVGGSRADRPIRQERTPSL